MKFSPTAGRMDLDLLGVKFGVANIVHYSKGIGKPRFGNAACNNPASARDF